MSKIAALLTRKPTPIKLAEPLPPDSTVDLDEELFSSIGAQLGSNNETLRNLLLNANHKIGELDGIKDAVGKLVNEPLGQCPVGLGVQHCKLHNGHIRAFSSQSR